MKEFLSSPDPLTLGKEIPVRNGDLARWGRNALVDRNISVDACDEIAIPWSFILQSRFYAELPGFRICEILGSGLNRHTAIDISIKCAKETYHNRPRLNSFPSRSSSPY
jgi:hypothetical protein